MVGIRFGRGSVCSFSRTVCSFYSSAFAKTEKSLSLAIATVIVWFQICDVFVSVSRPKNSYDTVMVVFRGFGFIHIIVKFLRWSNDSIERLSNIQSLSLSELSDDIISDGHVASTSDNMLSFFLFALTIHDWFQE